MADNWTPDIRDKITVRRVEMNLEAATIAIGLSCGHDFTFEFASHPVVAFQGCFMVPEVPELGAIYRCPKCATYGVISDEPVH